jgi:hypothetical protein
MSQGGTHLPPSTGHPAGRDQATEAAQIEEILRALSSAVRSHRLYEGSNPTLERFVDAVRQRLRGLWEGLPELRLQIEEDRILWREETVYPTGEAGPELPFLFYKDGVRELTVLPGFEEREVLAFLRVIARAPTIRREEDDLITLLWQEDFARLRYEVIEPTMEGVEVQVPADEPSGPIDSGAVREEAATESRQGISADEFEDTLYFLDEAEIRRLQEELLREKERDLWTSVLDGVLDRLEDGDDARQQRIVSILGELLPSALGTGRFDRAAVMMESLVEVAANSGVVTPPVLRQVRDLFDSLGSDETVLQLADILEEMPERLGDDAVVRLLGFFPPRSIGSLMRASERVSRPEIRRAFDACVQRLAEGNREYVVRLLESSDATVLVGAIRWIGRLAIGSAAGDLTRFLKHPAASVRAEAVNALLAVRAATLAASIVPLLRDPDRGVRIAAARALDGLSYAAGGAALEAVITGKAFRDADRTEKLAFFEAYGKLAGAAAVPLLERLLNTRSWLGRAEPADTRACAALALARIRDPAAKTALEAAARDADPVVRTAVTRALRGEA